MKTVGPIPFFPDLMGFFYAYKVKSFIRKGQELTMPDKSHPHPEN